MKVIDDIIETAARVHGLQFARLGDLSYLVNGKTVNFRPIEISRSYRLTADLINMRLKCAIEQYCHEEDLNGYFA
jgi:hypothetical protein